MTRQVLQVLWPAFLVAIVAEGVFFSLFDPVELSFAVSGTELSPMGAYTVGFLFFWLFGALASLLTCYLQRTPGSRIT